MLDTDRDGHIDMVEWCASEFYNLGRRRRGDGAAAMACWWRRRTPSPRPRERRRVSRGSPVGVPRREAAIEDALKNKLADRAAKRELEAARAAKEIEEFSNEFLNAARKCFDLIDVDCSGTLTKAEIVEAVQTNETVVSFLRTCGEPNLQFLLQPKRLERALKVLDTSNDGEVDVDECAARRLTSHPIDATPARRRGGAVL